MQTANPSITFITCIEAGPLEDGVVRMVTSLRKWGGRFSRSPIYAVNPRFDLLKIKSSTFKALNSLGVSYLKANLSNPYPWNRFLNKPLSVAFVESLATTEMVCFLDGDTLVVREPSLLQLPEDIDFTACPRDIGGIGTKGEGDPNDPHWKLLCETLGMNINELPIITEQRFQESIRMYFNAGVFCYRRSTRLGKLWLENNLQLLHARIAHPKHNIYFIEQAALSLSAVRHGLRIQLLDYSHNHALGKMHFEDHFTNQLSAACIIHYHEGMTPPHWEQFLALMKKAHPEVADWLAFQGPILAGHSFQKLLRLMLRSLRHLQLLAHVRRSRIA